MSSQILSHWESQARKHGRSYEASWGDYCAIRLEIGAIAKHIQDGDRVLDVGCGNGYALKDQKGRRPSISVAGVDFSPQMVRAAAEPWITVADATDLPFDDKSFDVVYTTRCLINLPTWLSQQGAIDECIRVAKRKVLFSEAFWEPLQRINAVRQLCGLDVLVEHDFNRYLKLSKLKDYLKILGRSFSIEDFSGVYYLGSRVLRELVTDHEMYEGYSNPINQTFAEIKYPGGGFGVQQLVVVDA